MCKSSSFLHAADLVRPTCSCILLFNLMGEVLSFTCHPYTWNESAILELVMSALKLLCSDVALARYYEFRATIEIKLPVLLNTVISGVLISSIFINQRLILYIDFPKNRFYY